MPFYLNLPVFWYFSLTSRKNVSRIDSRGRSHFPLPLPTPTSSPSLRLRPRYAHRHRPRTSQQQLPIPTGPQHRPTAGVNNEFITTAKEPPLPTYRSQRRPMAGTKPNFTDYRRGLRYTTEGRDARQHHRIRHCPTLTPSRSRQSSTTASAHRPLNPNLIPVI